MRVLYLTKCANKFSAYEEFDCKENLFKDDKFSFLEKKRREVFKLLKAKKPKKGAPLWRTYKDKFWEGLHMHVMPKAVKERIFDKLIPKNVRLLNFKYNIKDKPLRDSSLVKAYTMRYIVEKDINSIEDFKKINFLDFTVSDIKEEAQVITVYMTSEGKYSIKKAGII